MEVSGAFVSFLVRLCGAFLGSLTFCLWLNVFEDISKWWANRKELHEKIDKDGNIVYSKMEKTIDYNKERNR